LLGLRCTIALSHGPDDGRHLREPFDRLSDTPCNCARNFRRTGPSTRS
jgi:hypothetical protein